MPTWHNARVPARVVVLAGPSGSGKSRLAARLGLPVLRLDDFYKDGTDPNLPRRHLPGGTEPVVDWDHPASWLREEAVETLRALCHHGRAEVPVYEFARNGRTGSRTLDLGDAGHVLAEGIFAPEVVGACRDHGLLADAVCLVQHPLVTFRRRLARDLRERRKPPGMLLRRGLHLTRAHRAVVRDAVAAGCRPLPDERAYAELSALLVPS